MLLTSILNLTDLQQNTQYNIIIQYKYELSMKTPRQSRKYKTTKLSTMNCTLKDKIILFITFDYCITT